MTFNDNVGYAFKNLNYTSLENDNFYSLDVTGNSIYLNADVMTFETQEYSGPVIVGDNGTNGYTRTVFSMDPSITFNHTVDDSQANLHTLVVSALALSADSEQIPTITFEGDVGATTPLDDLIMNIGVQDTTSVFETIRTGVSIDGQSITYNGLSYNSSQTVTTFAGDIVTSSSSSSSSSNVNAGYLSPSASLDAVQSFIQFITDNRENVSGSGQPSVEVGQAIVDEAINFNFNEEEDKTMLCALDDPEAVGDECAVD